MGPYQKHKFTFSTFNSVDLLKKIDQLIDLFCIRQCMFGLVKNEFMDNLFFRQWTIEAFSLTLSQVRNKQEESSIVFN